MMLCVFKRNDFEHFIKVLKVKMLKVLKVKILKQILVQQDWINEIHATTILLQNLFCPLTFANPKCVHL